MSNAANVYVLDDGTVTLPKFASDALNRLTQINDTGNGAFATANSASIYANGAFVTANAAATTGKAIAMSIVFGG